MKGGSSLGVGDDMESEEAVTQGAQMLSRPTQ